MTVEKIKELRAKLMLTQVEFAKLLGVSFQSVNRYENGKSKPTMRIKRRIAELCVQQGLSPED